MNKGIGKTRSVTFRAEAHQYRKLTELAASMGMAGNISGAMRVLIDSAPEPGESKLVIRHDYRKNGEWRGL